MISILIIGFGLLVAIPGICLVVYAQDGRHESMGFFVVLGALLIIAGGWLAGF